MSENFQKKSSNIFVTFFIGIIVISFMFTGYESWKGSPDTVAKVGDIPIKAREYQVEYERQLNFYKNIFGGKDLTSEQIENFRIKDNALRLIVDRKLILKMADELNIVAGPDRIKSEIKNLPYFKTNEQFDLNKYKQLLAANRLTPKEFEEDITEQEKLKIARSLLTKISISKKYIDSIEKFKSSKIKYNAIELSRESLRKNIKVSKTEINSYLSNEQNKARVESTFKERKENLDVPEQVQASHILLKVASDKEDASVKKKITDIAKTLTPANFKSMANKYTEDPSGKNNGGSLGTFGKGRMVPEFEQVAFSINAGQISKPVKTQFGYHIIFVEKKLAAKEAQLSDWQNKIATEFIQGEKADEFNALVAEVTEKMKSHVSTKAKVEAFKKLYTSKVVSDAIINKYEGATGEITFNDDQLKQIYSQSNSDNQTHVFNDGAFIKVAFTGKLYQEESKTDLVKAMGTVKNALGNKMQESILASYRDNAKVQVFNDFLRN